jgi:hypothetical protein
MRFFVLRGWPDDQARVESGLMAKLSKAIRARRRRRRETIELHLAPPRPGRWFAKPRTEDDGGREKEPEPKPAAALVSQGPRGQRPRRRNGRRWLRPPT